MHNYRFNGGILKSRHKSYKLIKPLRYSLTILMLSQVILNWEGKGDSFSHVALTTHFSIILLFILLILLFSCFNPLTQIW